MDNYGKGRPSVMKITRLLLDEDGWRGFYRGFGPSFLNMFVSLLKIIIRWESDIKLGCAKLRSIIMYVIRFLCNYCTLPFYRICVSLQRTVIVLYFI